MQEIRLPVQSLMKQGQEKYDMRRGRGVPGFITQQLAAFYAVQTHNMLTFDAALLVRPSPPCLVIHPSL